MPSKIQQCRECKKPKLLKQFSLDRGKHRRICKVCASDAQSKRYAGQGADGRARVLHNWNEYFERDPIRACFTLAKSAAKQCGHVWELSLDEYRILRLRLCYYCDGMLPPKGRGLDRIDNDRGYTSYNVLPCCTICNRVRGNHFTVEETCIAVQAVLAHRRKNA